MGEDKAKASTTALMVAGFRAKASAVPDAIINDPWAAQIVGDDMERVTAGFLKAFPPMTLWIAVRTAFLDACVQRYTEPPHSFSQVVILGAGYDTRAARLRAPGVRFFEVDTPASQAEKRHRLASLPGYPQDAANYTTCDFEREDFIERLATSGLSLDEPVCYIWEGVSYYLTEAAVQQTLQTIAVSHPRSVLAFDYVGKQFISRMVPQDQQKSLDVVAGMGEPMQWGCNDILPLLYGAGFRSVYSTSFDQACLNLTNTYDRTRMFRFQSLAIASPQPAAGPLGLVGT